MAISLSSENEFRFPFLSDFLRWLISAYILLDYDQLTPEQWFAGSMDRASDFGSEGSGFESLVNRNTILFETTGSSARAKYLCMFGQLSTFYR